MPDATNSVATAISSHSTPDATSPEGKMPSVSLAPQPASSMRTMFAIGAAIVAGAFLTGMIGQEKSTELHGRISAPQQAVIAPCDGEVLKLIAPKTELVHSGQPLLLVRDLSLVVQQEAVDERIAAMETDLARAEAKAVIEIKWRFSEIDAQIHRHKVEATELLQKKLALEIEEIAYQEYGRPDNLAITGQTPDGAAIIKPLSLHSRQDQTVSEENLVSETIRLESTRNAIEVTAAQLELVENRIEQLEPLKRELTTSIRESLGIPELEQQIDRAKKARRDLDRQATERMIAVPQSGSLKGFALSSGDLIQQGETIASVADEQDRFLEVTVPSRELTKMTPETEVRLTFPGGIDRMGRVSDKTATVTEAGQSGETHILVKVEPAGKLWPEVPLGSSVIVKLPE